MKLVYEHESSILVHSAKNVLESKQINCTVKNEYSGTTGGAVLGIANTYLELWIINDRDFDKAKSIINSKLANPENMKDQVCKQCNETNDNSFEVCWKCKTVRV